MGLDKKDKDDQNSHFIESQVTEHTGNTIGRDAHAKLRLLLYLTVAHGFVRVYSQFYFLSHTSATSLALSNLAVQATPVRFLDHLIGIAASSRRDRRFIISRPWLIVVWLPNQRVLQGPSSLLRLDGFRVNASERRETIQTRHLPILHGSNAVVTLGAWSRLMSERLCVN